MSLNFRHYFGALKIDPTLATTIFRFDVIQLTIAQNWNRKIIIK